MEPKAGTLHRIAAKCFAASKRGIIAQFSCQSDNFTLYEMSIAIASRARGAFRTIYSKDEQ
jgi:hypothetical protein